MEDDAFSATDPEAAEEEAAAAPESTDDNDKGAGLPEGGWLALVATPIGNLEDITLRALRVLRAADLIAAEDTRRARRLLSHFTIPARLTPYHAHNEHHKTGGLLDQVAAGRRIAVLSDAGTPGISDPGFLLVRAAIARGIEPLVIPGVSALTFAAVAAGLPVDQFGFVGFPPVKSGRRRQLLERLRDQPGTWFMFESPHRVERLLGEIAECIGPDTPVVLVREATKLFEECRRGTPAALLAANSGKTWRGEFVVALDSRPRETGG